jgi:hypothetical protein
MRSLGGVTTFLFASVTASGIRILSYLKVRDCAISLWIQLIDLFIQWGRKERFVLAASLSFGMGNLLAPGWFEHLFDGVTSTSKGLNGFLSSITIILSAPCKFCPNFFYISRLLKDIAIFQTLLLSWSAVSSGISSPTTQRPLSDTTRIKQHSSWGKWTRPIRRCRR